jgi:hypothetical protein
MQYYSLIGNHLQEYRSVWREVGRYSVHHKMDIQSEYMYRTAMSTLQGVQNKYSCVRQGWTIGSHVIITPILTIFARSNAGIVDSNPTRGMDACVRLFCVCVVLRVGSSLATD